MTSCLRCFSFGFSVVFGALWFDSFRFVFGSFCSVCIAIFPLSFRFVLFNVGLLCLFFTLLCSVLPCAEPAAPSRAVEGYGFSAVVLLQHSRETFFCLASLSVSTCSSVLPP